MEGNTLLSEDKVFFPNMKGVDFDKYPRFKWIQDKVQLFWESKLYFILQFAIGAICLGLHETLIGITIIGIIGSIMLIFCEDILATTFPAMVMMCMATQNYDNLGMYFQLIILAAVIAICIVTHLIIYRKPLVVGKSFPGLCLVSVATLLGGLGTITAEDYFSLTSLYHMLALGPGMLLVYLITRSQSSVKGKFQPIERFARSLYGTGMFVVFIVFLFYYENAAMFKEGFTATMFPNRNFCATILLICMAVPCYFVLRSNVHIISSLIMYLGLLMTGSRSGMFFGTILLVGIFIYIFKYNVKYRRMYLMILLVGVVPFIVLDVTVIRILFESRAVNGTLLYFQESRIEFFKRSLIDFFSNPLFGAGIGNTQNLEVFPGAVPGSLVYYHNYIAQIIGSMGIVGVFAYGVMLYERMHLIATRFTARTGVFIIGYAGIFLMSMLNPGEFGPVPYEMLVVMIFALIEGEPIVERNEKTGKRIKEEDPIEEIGHI